MLENGGRFQRFVARVALRLQSKRSCVLGVGAEYFLLIFTLQLVLVLGCFRAQSIRSVSLLGSLSEAAAVAAVAQDVQRCFLPAASTFFLLLFARLYPNV